MDIIGKAKAIIDPKLPLISNLSNASAILNEIPGLNWVGFYIANGDNLYLGPFQGEPACTVIPKGKGVCGTCFEKKETIVVDDVDLFPSHIRCSSKSKSELVVPILKDGHVVAVIDLDSPSVARFGQTEAKTIEKVADLLSILDW